MATPNLKPGICVAFGLTAGLVAYKAYRAYESRDAAQPPIPAAVASDKNNGATPINIQGPRKAIMDRIEEDQRTLRVRDLIVQNIRVCTCDACTPSMYFNHPLSCQFKHAKDDIVVEAHHRPKLIVGVDQGAYEGLSLARCTIAYFSRAQTDMDSKQRAALTRCQIALRDHKLDLQALHAGNGSMSNSELTTLANDLNEVFFFGAINNMTIEWNTTKLDTPQWAGTYGLTEPGKVDGKLSSKIFIHPLRNPDPGCHGQKLAEHRLGAILHELLHAFLQQNECTTCRIRSHYSGHHGRAWQRVAKAIEDRCLDLLGMEAVLGRCTSMLLDRAAQRNYSVHDLQDWGFVEQWP